MGHASEYSRKLVSAGEAVRVVKSGDWVQYGHHANSPAYITWPGPGCRPTVRGVAPFLPS